MHFYKKSNFLLALWKILIELNPKQGWIFEKKNGWSYGEKKYLGPEDPIYGYLIIW